MEQRFELIGVVKSSSSCKCLKYSVDSNESLLANKFASTSAALVPQFVLLLYCFTWCVGKQLVFSGEQTTSVLYWNGVNVQDLKQHWNPMALCHQSVQRAGAWLGARSNLFHLKTGNRGYTAWVEHLKCLSVGYDWIYRFRACKASIYSTTIEAVTP